MKEAKPGNIHYIFLKAYVNEPIISMLKLLGNVPDKFCSHLNRRTEQLKLDRRVSAAATSVCTQTSLLEREAHDSNQVAAPTETPTLHRANIAHTRVRSGLAEWELIRGKKKMKCAGIFSCAVVSRSATCKLMEGALGESLKSGRRTRRHPLNVFMDFLLP